MSFKIEKTKLSDFKVREYVQNVTAFDKHVYLAMDGAKYTIRSIYPNRKISGWVNDDDKYVYGIHVQKFRPKTKQTEKVLENGKMVTKSIVVRKPKWIYTVYKFPVSRVKCFIQYNQHFDVVLF